MVCLAVLDNLLRDGNAHYFAAPVVEVVWFFCTGVSVALCVASTLGCGPSLCCSAHVFFCAKDGSHLLVVVGGVCAEDDSVVDSPPSVGV